MNKKSSLLLVVLTIILTVLALTACSKPQTPQASSPTIQASLTATTINVEATPTAIIVDTTSTTATDASLSTETTVPTATPLPLPPAEPIGGIELHRITDRGGLTLLQGTNTYWIRRNALFWSDVEPNPGDRNWAAVRELETELQTASERGYQVILIIRNTPEWARANPDYQCGPIKSDKLEAFASFVKDAVARLSTPPYNVTFWELGNEPDVAYSEIYPTAPYGCWGDENDPFYGGGYYAEMLKIVYPQIKGVNPEAQVLVGGLLLDCDPLNPPETSPGSGEFRDCTPARYLEGILQNGGGDYFDGISFHAYDFYFDRFPRYGNLNWHSLWNTTGPTLITKTEYLRSLLGIYGYPDKFLMNTETALLCLHDENDPVCQTEEFDQAKGNYAAQSYAAALAEGLRANIWYSITGWRGSGLVKSNQRPTLASTAYAFSLHILDQAAYRQDYTDTPGILGYKFERNGQALWVIWSIEENPKIIDLPAIPQTIYDVYGNALPSSQSIEISNSVIYIEFAP